MPIELSSPQKDALTELINIGFGRAANALSILVDQRVIIEAPYVSLYPLANIQDVLGTLGSNDLTSVHQVFYGRISGTAILLMDHASSSILARLFDEHLDGDEQSSGTAESGAIQEIGNILLNAFTGSFGNLLQVHISFTVPKVHYASLRNMMNSLMIDQRELEYALVVRVNFKLVNADVNGYVLIMMGIQSIASLLDAMRAAGYID